MGGSRRTFVVGNWKMHKTVREAVEFASLLKRRAAGFQRVQIAVAPPMSALERVARELEGSNIGVAAQNCHWAEAGAFTGEVSAPMLKDLGCHWSLVGHSERRQLFGETDVDVRRKVEALLKVGIHPIVCVGETLADRDAGRTRDVVGKQVQACVAGLSVVEANAMTIAYEPVWAIGTGRTASPEQAQEVHQGIRALWGQHLGEDAASALRIQYGGSVKPDNAQVLLMQPDIDGALVGGASLDADAFVSIAAASPER